MNKEKTVTDNIRLDGIEVSTIGFTLIRNLLEGRIEGGQEVALAVAEALHNVPAEGNDFTNELTQKNIQELCIKYPVCSTYFGKFQ